jgi:hypothetical protein
MTLTRVQLEQREDVIADVLAGASSTQLMRKYGSLTPLKVTQWRLVAQNIRSANGVGPVHPVHVGKVCLAPLGADGRAAAPVPPEPTAAPASLPADPPETHERTADSWQITLPNTRIHTLEQLIEHCKIDPEEWVVDRWICNKWEVGAKNAEGELVVEPLYQVKAFLKRVPAVTTAKSLIASLLEDVKAHAPVFQPIRRPQRKSGIMFEPSLYDVHFGKRCWSEETRGEDYDLEIARRVFDGAVDNLVERAAAYQPERICFVVGNDLLHFDNLVGTTTKGTPLDVDTRYQRVVTETRRAVVAAVERFRQLAPVTVVMVPGNHDTQSVFCLGDAVYCWFHNAKDITVDNRPTQRKYVRHGQVGLMFTHGDKGKLADLPLQMAVEEPDLWASTRYREIHTGDKHKVHLEEFKGIRVRIIPSLCSADAWHSENLYTNSIRSAEGYLWDAEEGLVGTMHYNVRDARRAA